MAREGEKNRNEMRFGGKKSGPRRTAAQIRKDAMEAVSVADSKKTAPRRSFRNPKPREVEVPCCLDKDRPLPQVFKVCPDCPKLTEAGSLLQEVVALTGTGS